MNSSYDIIALGDCQRSWKGISITKQDTMGFDVPLYPVFAIDISFIPVRWFAAIPDTERKLLQGPSGDKACGFR